MVAAGLRRTMLKRKRGSVFVFTVVMVLMTTTLLVAASVLTGSSRSGQFRRERDAMALASFQGVSDQVKADSSSTLLSLPIVKQYTCGGQTWNVTVSDNSASLAHSVLISATTTIGPTSYSMSGVVVQRYTPSPLNYCLAVNNPLITIYPVTAGSAGANGDIYVNGTLSLSSIWQSTINGDLDVTQSTVLGDITVTGTETKNVSAMTFPAPNANTYKSAATTVYSSGTTLKNISFPAPTGSNYPIFYVNGSANIRGTITGDGVIFVNGNVNVPADLSYANGSSRVAIIVNGDVIVPGACNSLVGYWYCTGNFSTAGIATRTVSPGAISTTSLTLGGGLSITYDPDVFTYPSEAQKFCLPGYWP
jgi:cytoskeletal protein CcmA (bactofilin family)